MLNGIIMKVKFYKKSFLIRFSNYIYHASNRYVLIIAGMIFFLFSILVLPEQAAEVDVRSPDLSLFYSSGDLYDIADALGESGRIKYIHTRFSFDVIFPLIYSFFLTTALSEIFKHLLTLNNPLRVINLLPILGMGFDILENISASLVMYLYPYRIDFVATMTSFFTLLKWISLSLSFVFILVGLFWLLSKLIIKRFSN